MGPMHPLAITKQSTSAENTPRDPNVRASRRIQGTEVPEIPSLEDVERTARHNKRLRLSPSKEKENNSTPQGQVKKNTPGSKTSSGLKPSQGSSSGKNISSSSKSLSVKKPVRKDIWGSKSYRKRKKKRKRVESEVEDFTEIQNDEQDVDDDVNDENIDNDNDEIQEGMATDEEEAMDGTTQCSPRNDGKHSPRRLSTEKSADGKSPRRDSMNELTVDVHMKSPKKDARSPSQRSPRADGQKSPQVGNRSQNESPSRSRSPKHDSDHMTSRHSSGGRSPRAQDNQASSVAEIEHKPPRNLTKSPERIKENTHIRNLHIYDETCNQNSPQKQVPSSSSTNIDKCVVLPGNGFVDSGIGSSDSNGDSNDSVGKLANSSDTSIQVAATSISQVN